MLFIEITHSLNREREMGKALVRVDDIVSIKEEESKTTKLYDDRGNVVEEKPLAKLFQVQLVNEKGGRTTLYIEEDEYTRLVALLSK